MSEDALGRVDQLRASGLQSGQTNDDGSGVSQGARPDPAALAHDDMLVEETVPVR